MARMLCATNRLAGVLALGLALSAAPAAALVTIEYTATDLSDPVPGQDRWHYAFQVSGPLAAFDTVELAFPAALFADLTDTTPATAEWLVSVLPGIAGADGVVDLLALQAAPGFRGPFGLDLTWLGGGAGPGAVSFSVLDASFVPIQSGSTVAHPGDPGVLPEPAAAWLFLPGAALLLARRRSRR